MTIILAAKNREGIVFCYDLAGYPVRNSSREPHPPANYHHKVLPFARGKAAVGFAGLLSAEEELQKLEALISRSRTQGSLLQAVNMAAGYLRNFYLSEQDGLTKIARGAGIKLSPIPYPRDYLFGVIDNTPHLLHTTAHKVVEVDSYAIGWIYPVIQRSLKRMYEPRASLNVLERRLEHIVKHAIALSAKRDSIQPLRGYGCSILTRKSYRIEAFEPPKKAIAR